MANIHRSQWGAARGEACVLRGLFFLTYLTHTLEAHMHLDLISYRLASRMHSLGGLNPAIYTAVRPAVPYPRPWVLKAGLSM